MSDNLIEEIFREKDSYMRLLESRLEDVKQERDMLRDEISKRAKEISKLRALVKAGGVV